MAQAPSGKTRALAIYLMKQSVSSDSDCLTQIGSLKRYKVKVGSTHKGAIYTHQSKSREPDWLDLLEGATSPTLQGLRVATASAVLVIEVGSRRFAICFGNGRFLLNSDAIEPRFGLLTTLNAIDPDLVRSIDRKTFESVTRKAREELGKASPIQSFGLEVERDMLRAVTGVPSDANLALRLTGTDGLSATMRLQLENLPKKLESFLALSSKDKYRARFPWVDSIREIRDSITLENLNTQLLDSIKGGGEEIILTIPEVLSWDVVAGFAFKEQAKNLEPDVTLDTYLQTLRKATSLTREKLSRDLVHCFNAEGDEIGKWSVYRCLSGELVIDGNQYVLSEGRWYSVASNLVNLVDEDLKKLKATTFNLPEFKEGSEADYNRMIAEANPTKCALLDTKVILHGGGRSRVEVCDLYTKDKQFLHVKKYGGSSALSHLFAQGANAAVLLLNDAEFRSKFNDKVPKGFRFSMPAKRLDAGSFEIGYVVLSRNANENRLPFFSRLSLRNAARQLTGYGFRVSFTHKRQE